MDQPPEGQTGHAQNPPAQDPPAQGNLNWDSILTQDMRAKTLSERLHRRAFEVAKWCASLAEARAMEAGCMNSAGSFLGAVPGDEGVFVVEEGSFTRALRRYNARGPVAATHHPHHCLLSSLTSGRLYSCPDLDGFIGPHDAAKNILAVAIRECDLTPVVPRADAPGGARWNADIRFIAGRSARTYVVDVSIVNVDSTTQLRRRGGVGDVEAALREREEEKRGLPVARQIISEQGSHTIFVPFVMSSAGGFGPAARDFLKLLYKTARDCGRWEMSNLQHLHSTWATMYASSYWDMRLSMAATITSAEVVGRLIVRDANLNMASAPGRRPPHPNPNVNDYGRRSGTRGGMGFPVAAL